MDNWMNEWQSGTDGKWLLWQGYIDDRSSVWEWLSPDLGGGEMSVSLSVAARPCTPTRERFIRPQFLPRWPVRCNRLSCPYIITIIIIIMTIIKIYILKGQKRRSNGQNFHGLDRSRLSEHSRPETWTFETEIETETLRLETETCQNRSQDGLETATWSRDLHHWYLPCPMQACIMV